MLTLPEDIMPLLMPFRPVFSKRTWLKVQVLLHDFGSEVTLKVVH